MPRRLGAQGVFSTRGTHLLMHSLDVVGRAMQRHNSNSIIFHNGINRLPCASPSDGGWFTGAEVSSNSSDNFKSYPFCLSHFPLPGWLPSTNCCWKYSRLQENVLGILHHSILFFRYHHMSYLNCELGLFSPGPKLFTVLEENWLPSH